MIRPITPDDTDALIALAASINLFSPDELEELYQMLTNSLSKDGNTHPFWIADDDDGLVGLAYSEPERMTNGTWNLQLIAVHPTHQRTRCESATFCRTNFGRPRCTGLTG